MSTPINWAGAWSGTTTYAAGDAVSYLGSSFIAVTSNTNVIPTSSEGTWNLLASQGSTGPSGAAGVAGASGAGTPQGLHWRGTYSALTAYNAYDCVSYSNSSYICTANGVLNKEPDNNPAYWGVLCVGNGEGGEGAISWGDIGGTLSDQADLETALNAKANTASLATVATSGSYTDLANKPTIPAAQVNSDWDATSGAAEILNKPAIPTFPTDVSAFTNDAEYLTPSSTVPAAHVTGLSTVATSGSYNDLSNKPTIPTAGIAAVAHDTSLVGDGDDTPLNLGALQSKSTSYTMLVTDLVCLASGAITITLTTSGASVGKLYRVKNTGTGTVTIQGQSGTIDGGSTAALSLQYQSVDIVFDGTNFWIL